MLNFAFSYKNPMNHTIRPSNGENHPVYKLLEFSEVKPYV